MLGYPLLPIPSALLVKNGSKTSFILSSGMPGPQSDTDSSANFSTREVRNADDPVVVRSILHRVDPVRDKVQNDLLKLDAVAEDRKRIRCDHTNQFDLSSNGNNKFDGLSNEVIEVEAFQFKGCFFQQTAHPPDDFTSAPVILHNILHNILQFSDVGVGNGEIGLRFRHWSK